MDDQIKIQDIIDKTKMLSGNIEKDHLIGLIKNAMNRLAMKEKKPSHILLGCTELPQALGKSGIEQIKRELGVTVIDTELEIANQLSKMLRKTLVN